MASWLGPAQPRWRPPRGLRRLLERNGVASADPELTPGSLEVLVVVAPLGQAAPSLDDVHWRGLRPGGMVIDLAWPGRRSLRELLRPWSRRQRLCDAAASRVRYWLERGAFAPEQFVAVSPAGVVVTLVRRAVGYPTQASPGASATASGDSPADA